MARLLSAPPAGRVWVNAESTADTLLVARAILAVEHVSDDAAVRR